jgi:NAD(P)-dependent dehydrogenase (short-subunit alcohol dehydrogenase family)
MLTYAHECSRMLTYAHVYSGEFEETLKINLYSSFSLLRNLARPMMKQKSGSLVFCSSAGTSVLNVWVWVYM